MNDARIIKLLSATGLFGIIFKLELYEKVILAYDPDLDERLKEVVDRVTDYFRDDLLVVHECDGALTMLWRTKVPEPFLPGKAIITHYPDGTADFWTIAHSTTTKNIQELHFHKTLSAIINDNPITPN